MVWSFKKGGEMSGIEILADTNAILYLFSGNKCMIPFMNMQIGVSVITEMELLSFPKIYPQKLHNLQLILSKCIIIPMDNDIKKKNPWRNSGASFQLGKMMEKRQRKLLQKSEMRVVQE